MVLLGTVYWKALFKIKKWFFYGITEKNTLLEALLLRVYALFHSWFELIWIQAGFLISDVMQTIHVDLYVD